MSGPGPDDGDPKTGEKMDSSLPLEGQTDGGQGPVHWGGCVMGSKNDGGGGGCRLLPETERLL